MDDRDTEYSLRIDGKYCVWQKYDLFELGEISSKIAKVAYENFSLPLPTRWVITSIVDRPEDHRNFLDEEELR